MNEVVLN